MKIHKIGQSCLVVEDRDTKVMTDPGVFTDGQFLVRNLDAILITHNEPGHFDIETIKDVINNNEGVRIITNQEVAEELAKSFVDAEVISHRQKIRVKNIDIEAEDHPHAHVYDGEDVPHNTGFHIGEALYVPGSSLENTYRPVGVLALPLGAPWMNVSDAINFAKTLRPKKVFSIHDGLLAHAGLWHSIPDNEFAKLGIEFHPLKPGDRLEV